MIRILLVLAACVVPLLVWVHPPTGDLFSFGKSSMIVFIGAIGMVVIHPFPSTILGILLVLSVMFYPDMKPTLFENWAVYTSYVIIFIMALKGAGRWLLPWIGASAVIVSLVGVAQWCGYRPISAYIEFIWGGKVVYDAITSTIHGENYIGHYCAMVLPLCYIPLMEKKWWYSIPTGALVALLMISQSWLGVLAVVVSFVFVLSLPALGLRQKLSALLAVTVLVCSVIAWNGIEKTGRTLEGLEKKINVSSFDKLFSSRGYIWAHTAADIELFGHGPGKLAERMPRMPHKVRAKIIDRPHNFFLQMAHALGLAPTIWILVLLSLLYHRSMRFALATGDIFLVSAGVGIIGFAVAGLLNDGGPGITPVVAVMLGAFFKSDS